METVSARVSSVVVDMADYLSQFTPDEGVWGGWPICPLLSGHPLDPGLDAERSAVWSYPNGDTIAAIGQPSATGHAA